MSKLQKTLFIILLYLTVYLMISYALAPEVKFTFISEEFRVGDKYVVMYLVAPTTPVFSDVEAADVFSSRQCGRCVLTNNKGFLPMSEYDAILVYGDKRLLTQTSAYMEPGKRYLIEAKKRCLARKLSGCLHEPTVTSLSTREKFDLCGLCKSLLAKRKM